jgi:hypothetical protein
MRERTELVLLRTSTRSADPAGSAADLTATKRRRKNDSAERFAGDVSQSRRSVTSLVPGFLCLAFSSE